MNLKSKMALLSEYDLLAHLILKYQQIPQLYKRTFWTVFIVLNIVFAFHTINFFWSNHDWPLMRTSIPLTYFWFDARFTQTLLYTPMGSKILPVLINIFGFFGLSLSTVLLAMYWNIPKKQSNYICFGLIISLMPYNLLWLYHVAQESYFYGVAIIISALMLFEKKWESKFFILWNIPIIILFFFVLGMNASYVNTIPICVIGRCFFKFIEGEKVSLLIKKIMFYVLDLAGGMCLLEGCIFLVKDSGLLLTDFYNLQHIAFENIPSKFLATIPYFFEQFTVTYPFIDSTYLGLLLGISVCALPIALYQSIKRRGFSLGIAGFVIMVIGLLLASQLAAFVAGGMDVKFWLRVTGYFGHYYIFSFMIALLYYFFHKGIWRSLLFIVGAILITFNVQRDMYAMRVWKQGLDAENKIMDRVMNRIEETKGFNYDNGYGIVLLGDFSLRYRYYEEDYKNDDRPLLVWSWRAPWETLNYFNFYAPSDFIQTNYRTFWNFDFMGSLMPSLSSDTIGFILKDAKNWPDKDSVFIKDGIIFVILEQDVLDEFKAHIALYLKQHPIIGGKKQLTLSYPQKNKPDYIMDIEFITDDVVVSNDDLNVMAKVELLDEEVIILTWNCCGREVFAKNNTNNIYEYTDGRLLP